jgi:SARP family transcriptional regulator, regulator of embCAB operon
MRELELLAPSYADVPPNLIGGAPGIDFLNTVEWRVDPSRSAERLTSYAELVIWCSSAGLITQVERHQLIAKARRQVRAADRVLRMAIELREAVVALFHSPANRKALDRVNSCLAGSRFEHHLQRDPEGRLRRMAIPIGNALRVPLDLISREIVAALAAHAPREIRSCANERCGWFFIDASRNSARRWCQMATCGNQAKARAHYARQRTARDRDSDG